MVAAHGHSTRKEWLTLYALPRPLKHTPSPGRQARSPRTILACRPLPQAAKELVELRDAWLNPPGLSEKELQKRTLTNLYNERPDWLDAAHKKLDAAVLLPMAGRTT